MFEIFCSCLIIVGMLLIVVKYYLDDSKPRLDTLFECSDHG